MVFSLEDRVLIKNLYQFKGYGGHKLVREFPEKRWSVRSVNKLIKRLRETGMTDRKPGSGRPRTSRTAENIDAVNDLILSQEST